MIVISIVDRCCVEFGFDFDFDFDIFNFIVFFSLCRELFGQLVLMERTLNSVMLN